MVLSDLSMKPVLRALDTTAASEAPIFIQGETGTGKELMARALHAESKRSAGPFVVLDCARLDPDTLEHQIFDTAKGAADPANGGTLFLDEIARMDPRVQARLIRFLKSRDIAPHVNGDTASVGVRLISASSENAHRKTQTGHFREDLYYRLYVVPITLPPLRERGDDIMAIANLRLVQLAAREGRRFRGFTPEAAQRLASYHWPGNVRQLINVVWNIVLNHDGDLVTTEMLPGDLLTGFRPPHDDVDPALSLANCGLLGRPLAEIERIVIEETIRAEGGSVPRAARVLNVSPSTIYRKRDGWARG